MFEWCLLSNIENVFWKRSCPNVVRSQLMHPNLDMGDMSPQNVVFRLFGQDSDFIHSKWIVIWLWLKWELTFDSSNKSQRLHQWNPADYLHRNTHCAVNVQVYAQSLREIEIITCNYLSLIKPTTRIKNWSLYIRIYIYKYILITIVVEKV